ncbi:MAG: hypothetical protein KF805_13700 [Phycisphaeraceae bacterium]|nr:hypothetical protein [Phycisphaeraceae bacterium]
MSSSTHARQWPEHLDAVLAAGRHHRILLENQSVRVLETKIEPGETVPLHTHRWPAAHYFLATGDIVRRDETGAITFDSRVHGRSRGGSGSAGEAVWSPALGPHTLENVGSTLIHVISVEVKAEG